MAENKKEIEKADEVFYVLEKYEWYKKRTVPFYYTGAMPTMNIRRAKRMSLSDAYGVTKYATTGPQYQIRKMTQKEMFRHLLKG